MTFFRCFMTLAAFVLFASSSPAFAEDNGPKALTQEQKDAINKKNAPSGFDISISPSDKQELKDDTSVQACELIVPKLSDVKAECCSDPKCRADIKAHRPVAKKYQIKKQKLTFEQQVKKDCLDMGGGAACESFEGARNYVNNRLCLKYGGDEETCNDPTKAREFVLNCRNGACRKAIADASAEKKSEQLNEGAPELASSPPPMYPPPPAGITGHEPIQIPPPGRNYGARPALMYYGAEFMGFANGPYGPNAVLRVSPSEYIDVGARIGYAYVKNTRMSDRGMEALNAGTFGLDGLVQLPYGRYSFGVGPAWNLVAQLGAKKPLIVQTVGGELRVGMTKLFGNNGMGYVSLFLGNNLAPKNTIMESGSTFTWTIGLVY